MFRFLFVLVVLSTCLYAESYHPAKGYVGLGVVNSPQSGNMYTSFRAGVRLDATTYDPSLELGYRLVTGSVLDGTYDKQTIAVHVLEARIHMPDQGLYFGVGGGVQMNGLQYYQMGAIAPCFVGTIGWDLRITSGLFIAPEIALYVNSETTASNKQNTLLTVKVPASTQIMYGVGIKYIFGK